MSPVPRGENESTPWLGRSSIVVLLVVFLLIAGGFVASAIYGQVDASAIDDEVKGIESNSLPSVEHLTAASTALRHVEIEAARYVEQTPAGRDAERAHVYESRRELDRELMAYLATPMYSGERPLYDRVERSLGELDGALGELYDLATQDQAKARAFADGSLRGTVEGADRALRDLTAMNGAQLHAEVGRIIDVRRHTIRMAFLLDSACVLFSIGAAFVAVGALRRQRKVERAHQQILEVRATELELFAKRVAHDLLSPLSALAFTLSSVKRNAERGDAIEGPLARANACLNRSQKLVDGVLDFARAGAAPASPGRAGLRETIDGVLDEARLDDVPRAPIDVEPFDDVALECSPGVLTSVLSNLVRNALKYMGDRPDGRVTLRVSTTDDAARVEVEDTGPGLAPGLEEHVFEPYVRAPDNIQPGLGLGLSTVRRFVEAHGGSVGVHSFAGRGCVFWFELPRVTSATESTGRSPSRAPASARRPREEPRRRTRAT